MHNSISSKFNNYFQQEKNEKYMYAQIPKTTEAKASDNY